MTNCPSKLRGDLSKWLYEINTGVYVGQLSARVRDALWDRVCENIKDGQATMVYSYGNEQHFKFRVHNTIWKIKEYDGLKLMLHPKKIEETTDKLSKGFSKASKRLIANKIKSRSFDNQEWAFVDIETTGLDFHRDKIIEIGVLIANENEVLNSWSTLVKIDDKIPKNITDITHINNEMLTYGVEIKDALKKLANLIKGKTVVCYNKKFDLVFLKNAFVDNDIEYPMGKVIDVLITARKKIFDIVNYRLGSLGEYFDIPIEKQHRALADCEILYKVFLKLNEI